MAAERQFDNPEAPEDGESILQRKRKLGQGVLETPARAPRPRSERLGLNRAFEQLVPNPQGEAKKANSEVATTLSASEQAAAMSQLVAARSETIQRVRAEQPDGSPEAQASDAALEFVERVGQRVQDGEAPSDVIESEYEATTADADAIEGEFDSSASEGEIPLNAETNEAPEEVNLGVRSSASEAPVSNSGEGIIDAPEAATAATGGIVGAIVEGLLRSRFNEALAESHKSALQKSLERQVAGLHKQLARRESQVRQMAQERGATTRTAAEVAASAKKAEQATAAQPERPAVIPDVYRMPADQVAAIAEKIKVGSKNVRELVANDRISERGARRIVDAYLRGGDVKKILNQELLIKAMAPELHPQDRDRAPESATSVAGPAQASDGSTSLEVPTESNVRAAANSTQPHPTAFTPRTRTMNPWLVLANVVLLLILGVAAFALFAVWAFRQVL